MPTFTEVFDRFPNAQNSTRVFLTNFYLAVVGITANVLTFEFYIAILGVVLTIFHLTILTRKSMRTTSIISIMISIAICDLISMILAIASRDTVMNFEFQECAHPFTYFTLKSYLMMQAIRDNAIRCSTWLSITMALIRYLVLKFTSKPGGLQRIHKLQRFPFGFTVFGVATVISTFLSLLFYLRSDVVVIGEWKPADNCSDAFPPQPLYEIVPSDLFKAYNGLIHHIFMCTHGIVTKILPCLLFPILTGLLIQELRKAQKKRMSSSKKSTERTTGLVIFMTISFFIALLPSGITSSIQAVYTDIGFLYLNTYVEFLCSVLLTLNATFHCFICFAMSIQYRKTVKVVLRIENYPNPNLLKNASVLVCVLARSSFLPQVILKLKTELMATFSEALEHFPNAPYSTRMFLANLYVIVAETSEKVVTFEFYLCFLGVLFTIFHLTILTRKSMRTSSIMSIMISVAICDLISMIEALSVRDIVLNFELQGCTPPITYAAYRFYELVNSVRDDVIRISTWLSVTMALIRYLVLKLASRPGRLQRVQSFPFGFRVFGGTTVVSTVFSWIFYHKSNVVFIEEWRPAEHCPDVSPQPIYDTLPSDLFKAHNGLVLRVFMFLNGTCSKILPCLLFPILTGLLILELRKAQKKRTISDKNNTERTTGLVIFMTVSFFTALLPSGIMTSLQAVYTDIGFLFLSSYVDIICAALLTLNSCLHCFICFAMSTQYRKTVKRLWKLPEKRRIHSF